MLVSFFQALIRIYSYLVSPFLGRNCRYHPTCSAYAHSALEQHGMLKGIFLTLCRVLNCHPWGRRKWVDPVPERFAWRDVLRYKPDTSAKTQATRKNQGLVHHDE